MKFRKCIGCGIVWLPKKEDKIMNCPVCNKTESYSMGNITAYQCKNRNSDGVTLLDSDGSKRELHFSWDEFNEEFVFIDTSQFWAKHV